MRRALALRMGYPMRLLQRLMTHAEFLDWAREFAREPFDDRRCFDQPAAEIRQLYANAHRPKERAPYTLAELMPYRDRTDAEPDIDAQILSKL